MLLHLQGDHDGSTNTQFRANKTTIPALNKECVPNHHGHSVSLKVPNSNVLDRLYRVTLLVAYLGWVDIDLDVPPSCTATQPILPSSPLPGRNRQTVECPKWLSFQPIGTWPLESLDDLTRPTRPHYPSKTHMDGSQISTRPGKFEKLNSEV